MARKEITVERPEKKFMIVKIVGDTPLIVHKFSEKAKEQIRDKTQKKGQKPREAKNPEQEFRDCLYTDGNGGYLYKAKAFKNACVNAVRLMKNTGLTMAATRQMFFVMGIENSEWVKLESSEEPICREDPKVNANGGVDLRYRPQFNEWNTELKIMYTPGAISEEQIINLLNWAGMVSGVGDERPQKTGDTFGMFHVA